MGLGNTLQTGPFQGVSIGICRVKGLRVWELL